jgi:hypothetical protein
MSHFRSTITLPILALRYHEDQDRLRLTLKRASGSQHVWMTRKIVGDFVQIAVTWIERNALPDAGPDPGSRAERFADLYDRAAEVLLPAKESTTDACDDLGLLVAADVLARGRGAALLLSTQAGMLEVAVTYEDLLGLVRGLLETANAIEWEVPRPDLVLFTETAHCLAAGLIFRHRRAASA